MDYITWIQTHLSSSLYSNSMLHNTKACTSKIEMNVKEFASKENITIANNKRGTDDHKTNAVTYINYHTGNF